MSVDKDMLEAIGQLIDMKLAMNNKTLREEVSQMMDEKLEPIQERQADQVEFERGTRVLVENVNKNIRILAEGHGANAAKLQTLDRVEMTLNDVKSDTEVIKSVVSWHSDALKKV